MTDGSGGSMGRALRAGMPADLVAVLMAARRHWRADNEGRPAAEDSGSGALAAELWDGQLEQAIAHPAAPAFDEVFVAAMRRSRRR